MMMMSPSSPRTSLDLKSRDHGQDDEAKSMPYTCVKVYGILRKLMIRYLPRPGVVTLQVLTSLFRSLPPSFNISDSYPPTLWSLSSSHPLVSLSLSLSPLSLSPVGSHRFTRVDACNPHLPLSPSIPSHTLDRGITPFTQAIVGRTPLPYSYRSREKLTFKIRNSS